MGRRNRPAHAGSDEQPDGSAEQRRHHDVDELHGVEPVNGVEVHNAGADGVGNLAAGEDRAGYLKNRRNSEGLLHREGSRTHGGTERVGDVIATNVEGHEYGEDDRGNKDDLVSALSNLSVAPNDEEDKSNSGDDAEEQVPNPVLVLTIHRFEIRHRRRGGAQNVVPFMKRTLRDEEARAAAGRVKASIMMGINVPAAVQVMTSRTVLLCF